MKIYAVLIYFVLLQIDFCFGQENLPENKSEAMHKKKKMYAHCEESHRQSPINIKIGKKKAHKVSFNYMNSHEVVLNLGHTVQLKYEEGSFISLDDKKYQFIQMHFHTPSEHLIEKKKFIMEAHLVHKSEDGHFAVVAVLFEEGNENTFLAKFIQDIPKEVEAKTEANKQIDIAEILPKEQAFYTYSGSLTTPPYTEGVNWLIFQTPQSCSLKQLEAIKNVEGFNARNVQKLNHRKVEVFKNQQ